MEIASLIVPHWNIIFSLALIFLLVLAGIYASARPMDRRHWVLAAVLAGLVIAAQFISIPLYRVLMLDVAAFAAVALVWLQDKKAGKLFFVAVLIGSLFVAAGLYLGGELTSSSTEPSVAWVAHVAVILLMVGFAIKLALIPFYFWLPALAENTTPMTAVLVISVLDMAEIAELAFLAPWIFTIAKPVWIALALITMLGGALLALAQQDLRRMLAFSAIDDTGYLLLGIVAGTSLGIEGVLVGILSHAFCKFLLFAALGNAEHGTGKKITLATRGLAAQFPMSAAAFIVGALGMVGVPPLLGSAGRWRLYLTGIDVGGIPMLFVMAISSILALLYYVRSIHRVWLGGSNNTVLSTESNRVTIVLILGILGVLLSGLFLAFGAKL